MGSSKQTIMTRGFKIILSVLSLSWTVANSMKILAFLKCATDLACASRIVRSHMIAFGQDCSGDGLVTCDDYVMMHKNGGWSCRNPIQDTEFWGIYQECKNLIISRGENV